MKNPDFKIRHFDIVRKLRDPEFDIDHELRQSISDLVKLGVMEMLEDIAEVSEIATKERQLESQVNKMRDEWKSVRFELEDFRDSGTVILTGVQPIWDLLDEHIKWLTDESTLQQFTGVSVEKRAAEFNRRFAPYRVTASRIRYWYRRAGIRRKAICVRKKAPVVSASLHETRLLQVE